MCFVFVRLSSSLPAGDGRDVCCDAAVGGGSARAPLPGALHPDNLRCGGCLPGGDEAVLGGNHLSGERTGERERESFYIYFLLVLPVGTSCVHTGFTVFLKSFTLSVTCFSSTISRNTDGAIAECTSRGFHHFSSLIDIYVLMWSVYSFLLLIAPFLVNTTASQHRRCTNRNSGLLFYRHSCELL